MPFSVVQSWPCTRGSSCFLAFEHQGLPVAGLDAGPLVHQGEGARVVQAPRPQALGHLSRELGVVVTYRVLRGLLERAGDVDAVAHGQTFLGALLWQAAQRVPLS